MSYLRAVPVIHRRRLAKPSVYLEPMPLNLADMGYLIEGVVEQDPMDERYRIRTVKDGKQVLIDPQELLAKYNGQDVKLTLSSLALIQQLQEELEKHGGLPGKDSVVSIQDFPQSTVTRKPD